MLILFKIRSFALIKIKYESQTWYIYINCQNFIGTLPIINILQNVLRLTELQEIFPSYLFCSKPLQCGWRSTLQLSLSPEYWLINLFNLEQHQNGLKPNNYERNISCNSVSPNIFVQVIHGQFYVKIFQASNAED